MSTTTAEFADTARVSVTKAPKRGVVVLQVWDHTDGRPNSIMLTITPALAAEAGRLLAAASAECSTCDEIGDGFGPSHMGIASCQSGSIASGGNQSHCTCDGCF